MWFPTSHSEWRISTHSFNLQTVSCGSRVKSFDFVITTAQLAQSNYSSCPSNALVLSLLIFFSTRSHGTLDQKGFKGAFFGSGIFFIYRLIIYSDNLPCISLWYLSYLSLWIAPLPRRILADFAVSEFLASIYIFKLNIAMVKNLASARRRPYYMGWSLHPKCTLAGFIFILYH